MTLSMVISMDAPAKPSEAAWKRLRAIWVVDTFCRAKPLRDGLDGFLTACSRVDADVASGRLTVEQAKAKRLWLRRRYFPD